MGCGEIVAEYIEKYEKNRVEKQNKKKYKYRKAKKMKKFLEIITGGIVGISIMLLLYIAPTL